jgi:hypothetical protein
VRAKKEETMRKAAILGVLVVLMVSLPAGSEDVKRTTALEFTSTLFAAALPHQDVSEEMDRPSVFMVARIHGRGLGGTAALQRESLSRFFNLPDLEVVIDSSETKLAWKSGTWKEYRTSLPRVSQTLRLNGEDYSIALIPHEIDVSGRTFKFILEIYRSGGSGGIGALKPTERIVHREILWDFKGPLAVGIYFPDKVYFMAWKIGIEMSTLGFRLGSGLSWTL